MRIPFAALSLLLTIPSYRAIAAGSPPAFDAASIRPSTVARNEDVHYDTSPGTLTIRGASLMAIVKWAWDVPAMQVDGPPWTRDAGFDIVAKAAAPAGDDELRAMLRTLLAERFGLKVHRETRDMQAYVLTLAKSGPKFKESTDTGSPEFTKAPKGPPVLLAHRVTLAELAEKMSEPLGKPVIDQSGLKGRYEIRIDVSGYATDEGKIDVMSVLFTAIQDQLGVKLDSRKMPIEMLVIDHAERTPADN